MVVVDTEEEFDWQRRNFDRNATGVSAMAELWRAQEICEEFGLAPTYVIDYPIATSPDAVAVLRDFSQRGKAQIGAHLHAWVNPPFDEQLTRANSYQGNLDPALEHRKLTCLLEAIETSFDERPTTHKAGRYGFGKHTAETLLDLGIDIDFSAACGYDFTADQGPNFSRLDAHLYRLGKNGQLLGIPTTGGFTGPLHDFGSKVYSQHNLQSMSGGLLASVLSKSRILERILLSPEGHTLDKMKRLTRALVQRGVRVFTISFHSPTVKPGCTPYTNTARDVANFLDKMRRYFEFFTGRLGGIPTTPQAVKELVRQQGSAKNSHFFVSALASKN